MPRIKLIFINSQRQLTKYLPQMEFLFQFLPHSYFSSIENLTPGNLLFFISYPSKQPLALCEVEDILENGLELHGVFRQDWRKNHIEYSKYLKLTMESLFNLFFVKLSRSYLQIQVLPENKMARGFAIRFGFKRQNSMGTEHIIYRLEREDYLSRNT